jgi:hypothetical protein
MVFLRGVFGEFEVSKRHSDTAVLMWLYCGFNGTRIVFNASYTLPIVSGTFEVHDVPEVDCSDNCLLFCNVIYY